MKSIRDVKTCTSVAAVLVALASATSATASEARRSKLPSFVGGAFAFGSIASSDAEPSFALVRSGIRQAVPASTRDTSIPSWLGTDEYKASWHMDAVSAPAAHAMGFTGKGVTVAVVDTGIDLGHREFAGRISSRSRSFMVGTDIADVSDAYLDGSIAGHGTMVSGLIGAARDGKGTVGMAPDATIMALRVSHRYFDHLMIMGTTGWLLESGFGVGRSFGP